MLQTIRDRLSGWLLWIVIIGITVPFALFGIENLNMFNRDPLAATVNGEKITRNDLDLATRAKYQQIAGMMGESFKPEMIDQNRLRSAALDELVQQKALTGYVKDQGLTATDAQVLDTIRMLPNFQDKGQFSVAKYESTLASNGRTKVDFETQVRGGLPTEQVRDAITRSAFVLPVEVRTSWDAERQTRAFTTLTFELAHYAAGAKPTPAAVAAEYAKRKATFMTPERVKVDYVDFSQANISATPPTDAQLAQMLKDEHARMSTPEERVVRHILYAAPAGDAKAIADAKTRAEATEAKLKGGADFAAIAKTDSGDPGSATQGGLLPAIRRNGQMVPEFEQAAFALKAVGDVSPPVKTQYGWHILKLDSITPAKDAVLTDPAVRAELTTQYFAREATKAFKAKSDKLETLAFENNASLAAVAKEAGVPIGHTDWVTRTEGAGVGNEAAVRAAVFVPAVLTGGENTKPIALGPGRVVVARVAAREAPRQMTLVEVSPQIEAILLAGGEKAQALAVANQALAAVLKGEAPAAVAARTGAVLKTLPPAARDRQDTDAAYTQAAFALPPPAAGKATAKLADAPVPALVVLTQVAAPPVPSSDDQAYTAYNGKLRDEVGTVAYDAFLRALETRYKTKRETLPKAAAPGGVAGSGDVDGTGPAADPAAG